MSTLFGKFFKNSLKFFATAIVLRRQQLFLRFLSDLVGYKFGRNIVPEGLSQQVPGLGHFLLLCSNPVRGKGTELCALPNGYVILALNFCVFPKLTPSKIRYS